MSLAAERKVRMRNSSEMVILYRDLPLVILEAPVAREGSMLDLGFFREALALLPCPRIQMDMLCRMTSWLCWLVHVRIIVGGQ